MDALALVLALLGMAISVLSAFWYIVQTFRKSLYWGLGNLFLPLVGIAFLVVHFRTAWKPFIAQITGILLIGLALAIYAPNHPDLFTDSFAVKPFVPLQPQSGSR